MFMLMKLVNLLINGFHSIVAIEISKNKENYVHNRRAENKIRQ